MPLGASVRGLRRPSARMASTAAFTDWDTGDWLVGPGSRACPDGVWRGLGSAGQLSTCPAVPVPRSRPRRRERGGGSAAGLSPADERVLSVTLRQGLLVQPVKTPRVRWGLSQNRLRPQAVISATTVSLSVDGASSRGPGHTKGAV